MEVRCDKCQARYRVDDARIGPQGLTMRCGKCQNTFKVSRAEPLPTVRDMEPVAQAAPRAAPAAAKPAGAKPAPPPAEPASNATMVFGQSPVASAKAAPTKAPANPKPAVARPAAPAAAPATADEGAGRTMMFQTGNLKTSPGAKAKPEPAGGATMVFGQSPVPAAKPAAPAKPAARPADPESGATMVFGQSPVAPAKPPPAAARPAAAKPSNKDDVAGSTMMFNASAAQARPAKPAPAAVPLAAPEAAPEPEPQAASDEPATHSAAAADEARRIEAPLPKESAPAAEAGDSGAPADEPDEVTASEPGTFDKAPPKGLLIAVAAGLALLVIAGGALFAVRKLGKHAPPPAAVETLGAAQTDADKDSLAAIASAEAKARDALDVAGPRSTFPEGTATLARIEIQWADALADEASALAAKNPDDPKVAALQAQAKTRLKAAFDAISPALKADPKSPDLQLALADYYRAQRSSSSMNKALRAAQSLKADDARVALVQGLSLLQDDDGAEKAIPRLKTALSAAPQSARIHYRLALAYQAMKDDANASTELKETMKLSPQHERAKLALESSASADGK